MIWLFFVWNSGSPLYFLMSVAYFLKLKTCPPFIILLLFCEFVLLEKKMTRFLFVSIRIVSFTTKERRLVVLVGPNSPLITFAWTNHPPPHTDAIPVPKGTTFHIAHFYSACYRWLFKERIYWLLICTRPIKSPSVYRLSGALEIWLFYGSLFLCGHFPPFVHTCESLDGSVFWH